MRLVQNLLGDWQRWTCNHQWVRARWQDGSYGLRCSNCMKAYPHTWNEIIGSKPTVCSASTAAIEASVADAPHFGLPRAA